MVRSRNLIGERNEGPPSGRDDRLVTPPGQIHSDEYNRTADYLLDPQYLAKEDDTRSNPRDSDQVLVDQDPVGPDAGDTRLPGRERESGGQDRREGHGRPRSGPDALPLQTGKVR